MILWVLLMISIYLIDSLKLGGAFTMMMKKGDLWSNEIWLNVVWMWCCIQYYNEIFIKLSYKLNYKYVLSVSTFRMHWYRLDEQSCQISTIYIILFEKLLTGGDFFFILNQHESSEYLFNTRNVKSEGRNTEKNYGYIVAVVAISVVAGICVIVELAYGVSSTLTY